MKNNDVLSKIKKHPIYKYLRNRYIKLEQALESLTLTPQKSTYSSKAENNHGVTMKLGVAYNLFDGEELLEYSIKSIRKNVDFICVVWQKISYHGEPCSSDLENILNTLKSKGLIDELYLYEPENTHSGGETSSIKRNIGLELCRKNGCNYHMTIDADEFYTDEQFRFMKEEMVRGGYGSGYCRHVQYYKDSIYQLKYPEREYVSTIEKITPKTKYVLYTPCPVAVSPERKTNNFKNGLSYRVFKRSECEMHHMSFIRKDIGKKLRNGSLDKAFSREKITAIEEYYKNWKYPQKCMWAGAEDEIFEVVEVPRKFEIYKAD